MKKRDKTARLIQVSVLERVPPAWSIEEGTTSKMAISFKRDRARKVAHAPVQLYQLARSDET